MKLTATGRTLQDGEARPIGKHTGLQIRKIPGGGVRQEVACQKTWKAFKSRQEKHLGNDIADPPPSPQLERRRAQAAANLGEHRYTNSEPAMTYYEAIAAATEAQVPA